MPSKSDLRQRQALPLGAKVLMSQNRIREWYDHWEGDVCVSFSGGKDSTVLAHLVRDLYPNVPLVFSNTGLEFPEIQTFARKMGAEFIRPKMSFSEVISKYGYPIISKEVSEAIYYSRRIRNGSDKETVRRRADLTTEEAHPSSKRNELLNGGSEIEAPVKKRGGYRNEILYGDSWGGTSGAIPDDIQIKLYGDVKEERKIQKSIYSKVRWLPLSQETSFRISHRCCGVMKKAPLKDYQKKRMAYPFIGTLAEESKLRESAWMKNGCNAFEAKNKVSQPLSFWTEQDILRYIKENGLEIASVYGEILAVDDNGFQYEPMAGCDCKLQCTGCKRTGCIFCGFGAHLDKGEPRFIRIAKTHPKQYEYCMRGGNGSITLCTILRLQSMTANG